MEFFKDDDFIWVMDVLLNREMSKSLAHIANRLLKERGRVVYARYQDCGPLHTHWSDVHYTGDYEKRHEDTHTALLINIAPIEVDTAEKIVTDLAKWQDNNIGCVITYSGNKPFGLDKIIERAKKLLGEK